MRTLRDFAFQSAALTSFVVGMTVVYSAIYIYGYFLVLGRDFLPLLTLSDYLSFSATALPYTAFVAILGMSLDPPWAEDNTPINDKEHYKIPSWKRNVPFVVLAITSTLVIYKTTSPGNYQYYTLPLVLIWVSIHHTYMEAMRWDASRRYAPIQRWMNYGVGLVFLVFLTGAETAHLALLEPNNESDSTLSYITEGKIVGRVVFITSSGAIYISTEGDTLYYSPKDGSYSVSKYHAKKEGDLLDELIRNYCSNSPALKTRCIDFLGRH